MRYTKSELRLFDVFSLMLVGVGILFIVIGILAAPGPGQTVSVEGPHPAKGKAAAESAKKGKAAAEPVKKGVEPVPSKQGSKAARAVRQGRRYSFILLGVVFVCLGAASNLGLRRVLRNKGEDVAEPHDEAQERPTG